jgi:heterotetrameric sarcosine oxidase delta subunit
MLIIHCPWCGDRNEEEFSYGGEAHIVRPLEPSELSDEEWADYLFMRLNTKGVFHERWNHAHGCRRWFNAQRDTTTNEFLVTYKMGETPAKGTSS